MGRIDAQVWLFPARRCGVTIMIVTPIGARKRCQHPRDVTIVVPAVNLVEAWIYAQRQGEKLQLGKH